jgi:hypothetical protein
VRILVTHVTRMAEGYCCVAGMREGDHAYVRPVLAGRLPTSLLAPSGGPFDLGAVVDLGPVEYRGAPPELEDYAFVPEQVRALGHVSAQRMWELLGSTASDDLGEIFGPGLQRSGTRAFVPLGEGNRSLGDWRPRRTVELALAPGASGSPTIRVRLPDERLDLSLTDARYYRERYTQPNRTFVRRAQAALLRGEQVILGVGLTRPFSPEDGSPQRHWLQVNALHLESNVGLRLQAER